MKNDKLYQQYLAKRALFPPWIQEQPHEELGMIVVIPAFQETALNETLHSLLQCSSPKVAVEVILVLNDSEHDQEAALFHEQQMQRLKNWTSIHTSERLNFHLIHASKLPAKKAGVGLARKIGLDEAIRRFEKVEKNGILICLDADTLVDENYLVQIEAYFEHHPNSPAASIAYAHGLEGLRGAEKRAIVQYELHLRIFLQLKRWTGFPFAYETIGSAMAVRAKNYCEQGGMNTRKAGEDFYFLNKFIALGNVKELNTTCVRPSSRISTRVPFGTGRAMQQTLEANTNWMTYAPASFLPLKELFSQIEKMYAEGKVENKSKDLTAFLEGEKWDEVLAELRRNTASVDAFEKRFFRWFDAFKMMKYLHFNIAMGAKKVSVLEAGKWIFDVYEKDWISSETEAEQEEWLLVQMRSWNSLDF